MRIAYPVPAETSSVFVVVTDRTPTDLSSIVPWRMGPAHRRAAMEALGTPRLRLEAYRAGRSPWRRMDVGAEDLKRVRRARYHVVVTGTAPVEDQPGAAQAARAAARGVAEAYNGTIYDPLTGAIVYHCRECPGESHDFRLGDDWLGWTVSCRDEQGACAAEPGAGELCECLTTTSRGLRRFGLPEVTLTGLACAHSLCAVTVLRTVAERLLARHLTSMSTGPAAPCRVLGGRLRVDGADVAVLTGAPDLTGEPLRVRLTPGAAARSCLKPGRSTGDDGGSHHPHPTPGLLAA